MRCINGLKVFTIRLFRYRHFYSDIFTVLTQIQQAPNQDQGDINILGQNLSLIRADTIRKTEMINEILLI